MFPTTEAFAIDQLRARREQSGDEYLQFLKIPSMRLGLYVLAAGADDKQSPHQEDEVYYILRGRAVLRAGVDDYAAEPGALLFVAAGVAHKFHSIREKLEALVFFSAARVQQ
jgi:mannose-6-phosphate isomerase-like protein (cupin superfamily)